MIPFIVHHRLASRDKPSLYAFDCGLPQVLVATRHSIPMIMRPP